MHITELHLMTANLAEQKQFYTHKLGFTLLDETKNSITLRAGATTLIFEQAEQGAKPFYHFAFNIAENKILSAKNWLASRSISLSQDSPDNWSSVSWNSHALYFYDPAGNIVEFIARHRLSNATPGEFTLQDILYVSEIGLVVEDVPATARFLQATLGLEVYQGMAETFAPLGDEHGLFIVVKRGRIWLASDKSAEVYPTAITMQGHSAFTYTLPQYPYHIRVVEAAI